MYKLIIIDDEKRVREALKISIDWEKFGIEVVGDAEDGDLGLEIIKEKKPDIIITDIYMARMDGLELTRKALEIVPHSKIIILSGYDNFDYAQTAIRHKAFDYLLKPIRFNKLEEAIGDAIKKIKEEMKKIKNHKELKKQVEKNLPMVRERYLEYILSNHLTLEEVNEQDSYIRLNLNQENFVVLVMEVNHRNNTLSLIERLAIKKAISNILFAEFKGEIIDSYPCKYISILNYNESEKKNKILKNLTSVGLRMIKHTNNIFDKTLTVGIGGLYKNSHDIASSYDEALEALEYKLFYGTDEVYLIQDINVDGLGRRLNYPFRIEEEIIMSIKIGDTDNVEHYVNDFITYFVKETECLPGDLKQASLQLIYTIFKKMIQWGYNSADREVERQIKQASTFNRLKNILTEFICSIALIMNKEQEEKNHSYIKKVCNFIKKNFHKDLSIEDIAESVYLSPNYLSNIFKDKTGKTIISYLTEVRIKKAKRLLVDTHMKIYEVGKQVGYKDSTYFGQVFKKQTGQTPNDYRKYK